MLINIDRVMRFRTWINSENSLNAGFPEVLAQVNKADSVPASAEVIRTGLQPQVDSDQIQTDQKKEQEKIQSLDMAIQDIDSKIKDDTGTYKINKFKKIWNKLKNNWEKLKSQENGDLEKVKINGLGGTSGNENLIQMMQQNPNTTIEDPHQFITNSSN